MTPHGTTPRDRSRKTLRSYFDDGRRPTGAEFAELIESMLNMQDEGFAKTPDEGLKIRSAVNEPALVTFFREEHRDHGLWSVRYGGLGEPRPGQGPLGAGDLRKRNPLAVLPLQAGRDGDASRPDPATLQKTPPLIALHEENRVSVGKHNADHMLDVQGMVAAQGRVGTFRVHEPASLLADGEWKDVTGELTGCVALEVVASVGRPESGHHAMLRAVALNAYDPSFTGLLGWLARYKRFGWIERSFNSRKRIRSQHAWFSDRCDRLELQWASLPRKGETRPYRLQVRTRCRYPDTPRIRLHVSELWSAELERALDQAAGFEPAASGGSR